MADVIATKRLVLRKWKDDDADRLYELASNPEIGQGAGWLPHENVKYSRAVIRSIFASDGEFAITLKDKTDNLPIGAIGIHIGSNPKRGINREDEAEVGYWIGREYWNRGFATEALCGIVSYCFDDIGLSKLWCGYFDTNEKSMKVMKKCGLKYSHRNEHLYNAMLKEYYDETMMFISIDDYRRNCMTFGTK